LPFKCDLQRYTADNPIGAPEGEPVPPEIAALLGAGRRRVDSP
jgi:hypothetical protein